MVFPARTALASVKAVAVDPDATIAVSGTALVSGENTVVVTVTAADGTVRVIQVPVYVTPLSSNANLSSFKVNGEDVVEGQALNVPFGTVSVPVVATPADAEALVAVVGGSALRTGSNQVVVTVTAANGTKKTFQAVIQVAKSNNTRLSSLTVNGAVPSQTLPTVLPPRSTFVAIKAVTEDPEATVVVSGTTLVPLSLYFKDGKAKIEIAVARGKKAHDKREALKAREADREVARVVSRGSSGKSGRASKRYED